MAEGEALAIAGAAWTATGIFALLVFRMWNSIPAVMGRWIEWRQARAAEKAADWTRLRDEINRLWEECGSLRKAVNDCEAREADWMHRAIAAEAAAIGRGESRQEAAVLTSAQRSVDKKDEGK